MINRIKGTQDFLNMSPFNYLIDNAKKFLNLYNFQEVSTPILEPTELFKRTLGQETDVISKEMYLVHTEKGDEEICLRPETTASTARAFVNAGIQNTPWKVFTHGPMFRHERPQKGRFREFHQLSMEIIGTDSVYQDVHFIKMLERFFSDILKLDEYALQINFLGCADDRSKFKEKLNKFLDSVIDSLCDNCKIRKDKNIMRVFDCKSPSCQEIYKKAPFIADNLCVGCAGEWQTLKNQLEQLSVSYSYVPTLVRGLDYYDKTVFEFVSLNLGAQNAFCSGGRYNHLLKMIGAKDDLPAIGAAMGIERLLLLLESRVIGLESQPLYLFLPMAQEQYDIALLLADELQSNSFKTDILLEGGSVKSMFRHANKTGAKFCIIIGSDEQKESKVLVKNMETGEQTSVAQKELVGFLKK